MDWNAVTAISSLVSMIAFIVTAILVAGELKALEKSRYLQITSELYATWQSREFMDAQLWLMHRLQETTWEEFIAAHRADYGEQAFHRVGSFYDRVGTLVRLRMVDEREILSTIGAYAIAVWTKLEPLVREARRIENSVLFDDFERLLPSCYECYVPSLQVGQAITPFTVPAGATGARAIRQDEQDLRDRPNETGQASPSAIHHPLRGNPVASILSNRPSRAPARASVRELKRRLDRGELVTVLDVRQPGTIPAGDSRRLPSAIMMAPDEVAERWSELPQGRDVVAYCT